MNANSEEVNKETESEEYVRKVHDRIHEILNYFYMKYDDTDCEALIEAMEREHNEYIGDE